VELAADCPCPILAVGGQLQATFALGRDRLAFLSHHLGDLDHLAAYEALVRDVRLYEALFGIRPELIVHDLHPDFASTAYARERAIAQKLPTLAVQHHHAHVASCLAEHGHSGPVIGVAFDGAGYGTDGAIWGGEFLVADLCRFRRAAHLRYVRLPGGDMATGEPWRVAAGHLLDADCDLSSLRSAAPAAALAAARRMFESGLSGPFTSSAGRLFEAVAAITGVCSRATYDGQAATALQWRAESDAADVAESSGYPFDIDRPAVGASQPLVIDTRPLVRAVAVDVAGGASPEQVSRRFHATLVELIAATCDRIRMVTGLATVALSGGVFLNGVLVEALVQRLTADGFGVLRQRLVPTSDGGLSLGQLAVAAACRRSPQRSASARRTVSA
jgi:hydrogenase maturation protein HypF